MREGSLRTFLFTGPPESPPEPREALTLTRTPPSHIRPLFGLLGALPGQLVPWLGAETLSNRVGSRICAKSEGGYANLRNWTTGRAAIPEAYRGKLAAFMRRHGKRLQKAADELEG